MAEAWSILADHGEKRQTALQPSVPPQKSAKARNSKAASVCRRLAALPSSPSVPFSWTVFVGLSDRPVNDVRLAFTFVPPSVPRRDASSPTNSTVAQGPDAIYATYRVIYRAKWPAAYAKKAPTK